MDRKEYSIKKTLILPLGIDVFLLASLLVVSVLKRGEALETGLFTVLAIPAAYLFLESLFRRITITEDGIATARLFGKKNVSWESITHAGGLTIKNKAYLLLTTTSGLLIISNVYDHFSSIAKDIAAHLEPDRTEDEFRVMTGNPPSGNSSAGLAWAAAVVLSGIVLVNIYPIILQ
jgi:hypothetical protein